MKKIGVGIISWNRPCYLKQLIETLEANDCSEVNFHLFQDGAVCKFTGNKLTDSNKIIESIKVFHDSQLPNKHYHIKDKNVANAILQFEAMRTLYKNYSHFIFLENDVIVSPNFIVVMRKLLNQFEKDKRVACISPGLRLFCKQNKVKENLDKLVFKRGHFWAEGCWAKKWKIIEKEYMDYYNIVKDRSYRKRNAGAIKRLFGNSGIKMLTTSQDNGKDWAIIKTGMKRARLVVNRATGIGDYGIHSTPAKLKQSKDGHNKIYDFKEELDIKKFRL